MSHAARVRVRLRIVATLEAEFADEEPASLPGVPVYDTTAEPAPDALAKCQPAEQKRRTA